MIKRLFSLLLSLLLVFSMVGCATPNQDEKMHVAVAIPPISAFLKAIVGDTCTVQVMVPPGYSPETYAPSPKELATAQNADLYFSVGVPAEREAILPHLNSETAVIRLDEAADTVYPVRMMGETPDPHRWLSPKRAKVMVTAILDALCEEDPLHAGVYEHNAHLFLSELSALDTELEETLADLQNRSFLVFHPAFGYLAEDYNLNMVALQQEGKEATPQQLQETIDWAREQGIRVIFYQEEIDSRQAEAFARELSGRTVALNPLSDNYIENLRQMAKTLSEAMGN